MTSRGAVDARQRALIDAARQARRTAYAPYSGFKVGAAVRSRSGAIHVGCNVENMSYGASICAERGAVLRAVCEGMRAGQLEAVAIYTRAAQLTPPCGMCLQVLQEFGRNPEILLANARDVRVLRLHELLPMPFSPFEGVTEVGRATSRTGKRGR
jgi:cytidine deaminase